MFDKKTLSEADIRTKYITPAITKAGWDPLTQMREEYNVTKGRIIARGKTCKREAPLKADYVLFYKPNKPIAIIEAKDNKHTMSDGMQQALQYASMMDIPFVFSSNGDGFVFHNKYITEGNVEINLSLDEFPSPETLWKMYQEKNNISSSQDKVIDEPYYSDNPNKQPRYYQMNAINKTVEAIANGQDRVLLVMATGTGKTYTAFQIIWRLWKSGIKKRILFLADRTALISQTFTNDFAPFKDKMTWVTKQNFDTAHEIYLALYQGLTGEDEHTVEGHDAVDDHGEVGQEGQNDTGLHLTSVDAVSAQHHNQHQTHVQAHLHSGAGDGHDDTGLQIALGHAAVALLKARFLIAALAQGLHHADAGDILAHDTHHIVQSLLHDGVQGDTVPGDADDAGDENGRHDAQNAGQSGIHGQCHRNAADEHNGLADTHAEDGADKVLDIIGVGGHAGDEGGQSQIVDLVAAELLGADKQVLTHLLNAVFRHLDGQGIAKDVAPAHHHRRQDHQNAPEDHGSEVPLRHHVVDNVLQNIGDHQLAEGSRRLGCHTQHGCPQMLSHVVKYVSHSRNLISL